MKRISVLTATLVMLLTTAAHAQFFGQLGPLGPRASSGLEEFGGFVGLASSTIGGTGELRIGLGEKMDVGIQAGMAKISNGGPTNFGGQVDVRIALMDLGNKDFKLGGDVSAGMSHSGGSSVQVYNPITQQYETVSGGSGNVFVATAIPCVSYSAPMGSGQRLSVWGGGGIELHAASGNTSTAGVMRVGGGFDFSSTMGIVGEWNHSLQTGGGDAFMVGVSLFKSGRHTAAAKPAPAKPAAPPAPAKKPKTK